MEKWATTAKRGSGKGWGPRPQALSIAFCFSKETVGWKSHCWSWWRAHEGRLSLDVKHLVLFLNVLPLMCEILNLFCFCAWIFHFLVRIFFLRWIILKVFIELVTVLPLFYVLVFGPAGMWDLDSLTRDWTHIPCLGRQSLNQWTARKVLYIYIYIYSITKQRISA